MVEKMQEKCVLEGGKKVTVTDEVAHAGRRSNKNSRALERNGDAGYRMEKQAACLGYLV
jgi:hypothetical protein